jgi:hypothetical protein
MQPWVCSPGSELTFCTVLVAPPTPRGQHSTPWLGAARPVFGRPPQAKQHCGRGGSDAAHSRHEPPRGRPYMPGRPRGAPCPLERHLLLHVYQPRRHAHYCAQAHAHAPMACGANTQGVGYGTLDCMHGGGEQHRRCLCALHAGLVCLPSTLDLNSACGEAACSLYRVHRSEREKPCHSAPQPCGWQTAQPHSPARAAYRPCPPTILASIDAQVEDAGGRAAPPCGRVRGAWRPAPSFASAGPARGPWGMMPAGQMARR